jgi:copper transport protein
LWGVLVGLVALLAGPASPASAHAALVSSNPTANSVVASSPSQVVLTFTEGVAPVTDRVHVIAPGGGNADSGKPTTDGDKLIIPMKPGGPNGTYLVNYRIISTDSHPIGGAFSYSVGAPSPGGPPAAVTTEQPQDPVIRTLFPVARWIGYVGLLLFVGAVLILALLWPKRLDRRDPVRVIWVGAGLIGLATVLELAVQVPYVSGGGLFDGRLADLREVIGSQYGAAHLVRLGVLAAALVLVRPVVRGRSWGADRVLLAALGAIGVGTWSVSGHPSATAQPLLTVVADMIHISAMSVWLGGLVMLLAFLLPRGSARELAAIVPIWSRWAAYAVSALVLTGVAQALLEVRQLSTVFTTTYGWLVVAKVGLAAVALAVASQSRRLVPVIASGMDSVEANAEGHGSEAAGRSVDDDGFEEDGDSEATPAYATLASVPARGGSTIDTSVVSTVEGRSLTPVAPQRPAGPERHAVRRLRGLVVAEALVAVVVLGVTSVLVQTTPARSAQAGPTVPSVQSGTMVDKLFTLTVDVEPAQVGLNQVHMYATTPDGLPATVKEWTVRASAPGQGIEPIDVYTVAVGDDHAIGSIGLPSAGKWTFTFTLRTSDIDESTVTTPITVAP